MKARLINTGEIVEVEQITRTTAICPANGKIYNKQQLDLNIDNPHPEATISGWVARNASSQILFFKGKDAPNRPKFEQSPKQWHGSASPDNGIPIIPQSAFPSLTWQDEPIEVEITIKPKKQ